MDDGLVRTIGLSNFNSKQIQNILDNSRIKPAMLQVRWVSTQDRLVNISLSLFRLKPHKMVLLD